MKQFVGGLTVGLAAFAVYFASVLFGGDSAPSPEEMGVAQAQAPIPSAEQPLVPFDVTDADPAPGLRSAVSEITVADAVQADHIAWNAIKATRDPSAIALYLSQNPGSANFGEAMAFLNELLISNDPNVVARGMLTPLAPAGGLEAKDFTQATAGFTASDLTVVMGMSALYPPLEGLPASAWEGKSCADCHNLSVKELCDHSRQYLDASYDIETSSPHPLGLSFKRQLKGWAGSGCP